MGSKFTVTKLRKFSHASLPFPPTFPSTPTPPATARLPFTGHLPFAAVFSLSVPDFPCATLAYSLPSIACMDIGCNP